MWFARRSSSSACRTTCRAGDNTRARKLYEKSIASVLPVETDLAAQRSLARLAKREGDFTFACDLWKGALGNSRQGYEAYEQLAIYYEHKARAPEHLLKCDAPIGSSASCNSCESAA